MEEIQQNTPLLGGHAYQRTKRCPKCTSVFISDDECEGCGYQLNYTPIGDAFGDKGFYGLKESYWNGRSSFVQLWPNLERKRSKSAKKYSRELSHRYDLLIDLLLGDSEQERDFYWIEFKDLSLELIEYNIPLERLIGRLNDHPYFGFAPLIHDFLIGIEEEKINMPTLWGAFLNFKVWGVLRVRFLLASLICLAAISTANLLVYQYFFLYS